MTIEKYKDLVENRDEVTNEMYNLIENEPGFDNNQRAGLKRYFDSVLDILEVLFQKDIPYKNTSKENKPFTYSLRRYSENGSSFLTIHNRFEDLANICFVNVYTDFIRIFGNAVKNDSYGYKISKLNEMSISNVKTKEMLEKEAPDLCISEEKFDTDDLLYYVLIMRMAQEHKNHKPSFETKRRCKELENKVDEILIGLKNT